MTRVALINPDWRYDGSIYFGCRSPHLPLELGISQQLLDRAGHQTVLIDAHMFGLSIADIAAGRPISSFRFQFTNAPSVDGVFDQAFFVSDQNDGTARPVVNVTSIP